MLLLAGLVACSPSGDVRATSSSISVANAPAPAASPVQPGEQITRRDLPPEARRVLTLIERGGPFPYRKDGVVFGNREGLLPKVPGRVYHEYTVPTPGEADRGARRIVCAGPLNSAAGCYYTADHYTSFKRIAP
ncbi:ribonuclease N [Deinococcus irradiatisoli]|uniref:Ribonuclease N n=1 Tax=Deinococcus irradiatisoli TaxID=2202254 RepID=A0A2Z3JHT1_9DEIO|nr:ribonuclease N [Deinococcus irradiatisoli]